MATEDTGFTQESRLQDIQGGYEPDLEKIQADVIEEGEEYPLEDDEDTSDEPANEFTESRKQNVLEQLKFDSAEGNIEEAYNYLLQAFETLERYGLLAFTLQRSSGKTKQYKLKELQKRIHNYQHSEHAASKLKDLIYDYELNANRKLLHSHDPAGMQSADPDEHYAYVLAHEIKENESLPPMFTIDDMDQIDFLDTVGLTGFLKPMDKLRKIVNSLTKKGLLIRVKNTYPQTFHLPDYKPKPRAKPKPQPTPSPPRPAVLREGDIGKHGFRVPPPTIRWTG